VPRDQAFEGNHLMMPLSPAEGNLIVKVVADAMVMYLSGCRTYVSYHVLQALDPVMMVLQNKESRGNVEKRGGV
jgi:hypothetical protein